MANQTHVLTPEQAAAVHSQLNPFSFDLLDWTEAIDNDRIKDEVMRAIAFSADGNITATLGQMLNDFYRGDQNTEEPTFDSYAAMLAFVESLNENEANLQDQGFEVTETKQRIALLLDIREEIWHRIHKGDSTKIPALHDVISNPRLRSVTAETRAKNEQLIELIADGDKELAEALRHDLATKDKLEQVRLHDFDKNRAKSLTVLFNCMNISLDTMHDDPFGDLDARTQFKLLNAAMRGLDRCVDNARRDNRVSSLDFATLFTDVRELKKQLGVQLKHKHFNAIE
jgi:hypothetical protein